MDLFNFSFGMKKGYKNVKTFADIPARSSGNNYYYPEFSSRTNGYKFSNELYHNLSRKIAWEAVFRIRLSQGYQQMGSYGNIQIKAKTQDLVLAPTIDQDRTLTYEFEKSPDDAQSNAANQQRLARISKRFLFIQSALLYSTSEGQRRIRCHNVAVPLTNSINEAYEMLDITSTAHLLLRKALARFDKVANVEQSRLVIEAGVNNMARACQRHTQQKGEFSENMQYLFMYALGIMKSPLVNIPQIMNPIDIVDRIVQQRFLVNMMSPDELVQLYSPQIVCVSDDQLTEEFPPLETLERQSLRQDGMYLLFNSFSISLYVGKQCDPWFIGEVLKAQDFANIDKSISEEEIFQDVENSAYLTALNSIIS